MNRQRPVGLGVTDAGSVVFDADPTERSEETPGAVLASHVVAEPDPSGDVWSECAERLVTGEDREAVTWSRKPGLCPLGG